MKVVKFGGTSVASAAQIRKVAEIVLADPSRRIVVVSAPGKRSARDTKVTDLLIALARAGSSGSHVANRSGQHLLRLSLAAPLGLRIERMGPRR